MQQKCGGNISFLRQCNNSGDAGTSELFSFCDRGRLDLFEAYNLSLPYFKKIYLCNGCQGRLKAQGFLISKASFLCEPAI